MTIGPFVGDKRWLSNFHPAKVTVPLGPGSDATVELPTVEHAYVVLKAGPTWACFQRACNSIGKGIELEAFCALPPGKVKYLGRKIQLRRDWNKVRYGIMEDLVRQKFSDPALARKLVSTGLEEIEELNTWHDNTWGICTCERCRAQRGMGGRSKNWLGEILMKVRFELRETNKPEVTIYVDGACSGNPGPGGWAALLIHPATGFRKEVSDGWSSTTNNEMEMEAVLQGLLALKEACKVTVVTDSNNAIGWVSKGWNCEKNPKVARIRANILALINEVGHAVSFRKVKAHSGDPLNDLVDSLAKAAIPQ